MIYGQLFVISGHSRTLYGFWCSASPSNSRERTGLASVFLIGENDREWLPFVKLIITSKKVSHWIYSEICTIYLNDSSL